MKSNYHHNWTIGVEDCEGEKNENKYIPQANISQTK